MKPHTAAEIVKKKPSQQKSKHDATARVRTFQIDDHVWFKNFGSSEQWIPGNIFRNGWFCYFLSRIELWEDLEK